MAVYMAKVREESASPGRHEYAANCDVDRSAYNHHSTATHH